MSRAEISELVAFLEIAQHASFARAAETLGVSRPTLSQTMRGLEDRLGVRLLNRTTRSVAPTEIGERLLIRLRPMLTDFDAMLEEVSALGGKPSGTLRLSLSPPAAALVLQPMLASFLCEHPAIVLEADIDPNQTNIVGAGFDAGIRIGERVERGMTALRLTGALRVMLVASPGYLATYGRPETPHDLHDHNCLRFRFRDAAMSRWTFRNGDRSVEVPVEGGLITNDMGTLLQAALAGVGIAHLPHYLVESLVRAGLLSPVLEDWMELVSGYFLYYLSRGHVPGPLQAFIDFVGRSEAPAVASR